MNHEHRKANGAIAVVSILLVCGFAALADTTEGDYYDDYAPEEIVEMMSKFGYFYDGDLLMSTHIEAHASTVGASEGDTMTLYIDSKGTWYEAVQFEYFTLDGKLTLQARWGADGHMFQGDRDGVLYLNVAFEDRFGGLEIREDWTEMQQFWGYSGEFSFHYSIYSASYPTYESIRLETSYPTDVTYSGTTALYAPKTLHPDSMSLGGSSVNEVLDTFPAGETRALSTSDIDVPSPDGYVIVGYSTYPGGYAVYGNNEVVEVPVGKSLMVFPVFAAASTVTFVSDGSVHATAQVVVGETVPVPEEPVMDGHAFTGWYLDEGCTEAFDFGTAITSDLTLYAGWSEVPDGSGGITGGTEDTGSDGADSTEEPEDRALWPWLLLILIIVVIVIAAIVLR